MRRLPGPAVDRLGEEGNFRGPLRIVSGLAENTNSIFCDSSSELEAANGCPVLRGAGTTSREAQLRGRMTGPDEMRALLTGIGLTLGLVGAYFAGRALHSTLYGIGSIDFYATGAVAVVMVCAALVASWVLARRAAALQPMRALRSE